MDILTEGAYLYISPTEVNSRKAYLMLSPGFIGVKLTAESGDGLICLMSVWVSFSKLVELAEEKLSSEVVGLTTIAGPDCSDLLMQYVSDMERELELCVDECQHFTVPLYDGCVPGPGRVVSINAQDVLDVDCQPSDNMSELINILVTQASQNCFQSTGRLLLWPIDKPMCIFNAKGGERAAWFLINSLERFPGNLSFFFNQDLLSEQGVKRMVNNTFLDMRVAVRAAFGGQAVTIYESDVEQAAKLMTLSYLSLLAHKRPSNLNVLLPIGAEWLNTLSRDSIMPASIISHYGHYFWSTVNGLNEENNQPVTHRIYFGDCEHGFNPRKVMTAFDGFLSSMINEDDYAARGPRSPFRV